MLHLRTPRRARSRGEGTGLRGGPGHDRVMRLANVLLVWAIGLVPVLGGCGSDARPLDEVVPHAPVTTTRAKPVATNSVSTTTPPTTASDPTRRFCTTDSRRGPNGKFYGRDPNQGCKFVDEQGQVLPDQ